MRNRLGDLNNILFEQLERLNDDEIKGKDLEEEINRARTITTVASSVIANGNLMLQAKKLMDTKIDADLTLPELLEG